ncbi:hypothetical protein [Rhodococcus chondri]|uniref:Secreted protein n=1 Tax=Rhodococcus chondri TaxID=3065941 RepID=A0ABU7JXR2_9NOCA|nr:hypothetical protein [Rhodococcus sp. CC-R104]MEE2034800.1 hypothetical protein [Rhodococcus sp. CC-R104]
MLYLLAIIGAVTLAVLLWKGFGPDLNRPSTRVVGPDDDPEFLWKVDREVHKRRGDGTPGPDKGGVD